MRIAFSGGGAFVAERFLHDIEALAGVNRHRREGVAKVMQAHAGKLGASTNLSVAALWRRWS